jgi:hypothetical protein
MSVSNVAARPPSLSNPSEQIPPETPALPWLPALSRLSSFRSGNWGRRRHCPSGRDPNRNRRPSHHSQGRRN